MGGGSSENTATIEIGNIPEGHVIVGYFAQVKVLDKDGKAYYAMRARDLNDMECYGMAMDITDSIRSDLQAGKRIVED